MKLDLYNDEKRFENWKETALDNDDISPKNTQLIYDYVMDMSQGKNIGKGTKKGARGYKRLNCIRARMNFIATQLERRGIKDISKVTEEQVFSLFDDMRKGKLKTQKGTTYKSVGDYTKVFKAFWHWHQKVNRKSGKEVIDITTDLDNSNEEAGFVLISKEDLDDKFIPKFLPDEQIVLRFVFDSLIRSPTELMSLQVKHIEQRGENVWVHIPDEISKVMGRSFNLLYCGDDLMKYIRTRGLKDEDYLFQFSYPMLTRKMQNVAERIWGEKQSHPTAKGLYREITLYSLRHSGAVHLRRLSQKTGKISLDTIRQRGGWRDFRMLNYYTKFIYLDGNINKEDLLVAEDKSKMEKQIEILQIQVQQLLKLKELDDEADSFFYKEIIEKKKLTKDEKTRQDEVMDEQLNVRRELDEKIPTQII